MRGAAREAAKTCEHYRGEIVVIHKQKIPSMTWGGHRRYFNVNLFFLDKSYHSDYYAGTNYANDNIANDTYGSKAD